MTGDSGTPLVKKLGIKAGSRLLLVSPPEGFEQTLGPLPDEAAIVAPGVRGKIDVVLLFVLSEKDFQKQFARPAARLQPAGGLWVCWPKKAAKIETDLTEDVVRRVGLESGLVDNKVCAVDETWSGLRFVVRLKDRQK
jgi:hypothetical protein